MQDVIESLNSKPFEVVLKNDSVFGRWGPMTVQPPESDYQVFNTENWQQQARKSHPLI
jgi:hypothetical protein